jgi:protein O-GlcNAc transferase
MRDLAQTWPDWDEPLSCLAASLRTHGENAAAMDAWRAALTINPNGEHALLALGAMAIEAGDPLAALAPLLRCCGLGPANQGAWSTLGRAYMDTGQPVQALAAYARAQHLAPRSIALARNLVAAALAAECGPREAVRQEALSDRVIRSIRCRTSCAG